MTLDRILNLLIALAYFALTIQLFLFLRRTKILRCAFGQYEKQREVAVNALTVGILFSCFIGLCGFTHFLKFLDLGPEAEWLTTFTLFITTVISVLTSVACYFISPVLLQFLDHFEVSSKGNFQLLENYLLEVVEMLQESIVVLSPHLRILRGNSVTAQFFGTNFFNRCMIDIVHPADFENFKSQVDKVMWSGEHSPTVFEYRVNDPNRVDYLWMESTLCLSSASDDGESQDLNMITRNITERKQFQLNREKEEALRFIEKMNESKLKYISSIAYDLKTPLHSFCFVLDLLKCSNINLRADQLDLIQEAHVSIEMMRLTISQTMDITKSLTGEILNPHVNSVKLGNAIDRVKAIINLFGSQVPVYYLVEERLRSTIILTDEEWLWQMMLNLLTNACKFTEIGKVELKMTLQEDKKMLLVEVIDTGIGVHPSKISMLYEAFSQIQDDDTSGTGLGLYGLKARVEKLGGYCGMHVNSASITGTGSVFWFSIPFILDEPANFDC